MPVDGMVHANFFDSAAHVLRLLPPMLLVWAFTVLGYAAYVERKSKKNKAARE